jgi:glutaredoxin
MSEVIIYGTTHCGKCKQLVKTCEEKNYSAKYVNVESGDAMFDTLLANAVRSFPALEVDGKFIYSKSMDEFEEIILAQQ